MSLRRTLAPARKYWEESGLIALYISSLVAASTLCAFFVLASMSAPSNELDVHWLVLVLGFAVVEAFVVNLHFRSESGSFSLLEIPLVIGLLFSPPLLLWLAITVGAGFSLAFIRRLPLLKLLFNLANLSLHVAVAAILFGWLIGDGDPLAPWGWLALFVTTLISSFVEVGGIAVVIGLSERQFDARRLKNMILFGALVALANTLQALIGVLVVRVDPWGSVLLVGSMAVLFLAYRGYVSERDHRERVEFLYESTRSLHESSEKTAAIGHLLEEAASMFRASTVELVLFPPPDSDDLSRRYRYENGAESDEPIDDISQIAALASRCEAPQLALQGTTTFDLAEHLTSINITDAIIGTLRSEQRSVGLLIVGNRLGTVTTFTEDDLRLFENLVQQSAVALENDQLEQALTRLRKLEGELSHQARYDQLTGLANRNLFGLHVDDTIQSWRNLDPDHMPSASLLYIDLDDFKLVNDRLGHAAGDILLSEVARRIESVIGPDDLPARLGGDEFAVMLGGSVEPEQVANQIIGVLTAPFTLEGAEARIGASVGVAVGTPAIESASQLLKHADLAMYEAKQRGKGSVVRYSEELESHQSRQLALHTSLRKAISDNAFEAMYQPIVRLDDHAIVGAEALVRWRQEDGVVYSPADFIDEAERSGLIISIDRLLRVAVLDDMATILPSAPDDFWVSLNISARHLLQPSFVSDFRHDVTHARVDPAALVVEVTESVFAGDARAAATILAELKSTGARVALDDFGTGYSSLSYLRDLPIDIVKIARPFITDLSAAPDLAFVQAITTLAHGLSMAVVAEGIEEDDVLASLRSASCEFGQGYLFGRPMPAQALMQRLIEQQAGARAA